MTNDPDDTLMERLRAIAASVASPPEIVEESARAALSTRRLDELAELLTDSDASAPQLVRGEDEVRLLSFGTPSISVELQLSSGPEVASIRGLVQGATGVVILETPTSTQSGDIDPDGWFGLTQVPIGLCRLRFATAEGGAVTTEWVSL